MVNIKSELANPRYSLYLFITWVVVFALIIMTAIAPDSRLFDRIFIILGLSMIILSLSNIIVAILLVSARKMPAYWYLLIFLLALVGIPALHIAIHSELSKVKPTKLCKPCAEKVKAVIAGSRNMVITRHPSRRQQGTCKNCFKKKDVLLYKIVKR